MCDEKVLREAFAAFDVDKNGTIGNHRATFTNIYNSRPSCNHLQRIYVFI